MQESTLPSPPLQSLQSEVAAAAEAAFTRDNANQARRRKRIYPVIAVATVVLLLVFAAGFVAGLITGRHRATTGSTSSSTATTCDCRSIHSTLQPKPPSQSPAAPPNRDCNTGADGVVQDDGGIGDDRIHIPFRESNSTSCDDIQNAMRSIVRALGSFFIEEVCLLLREGNTSVFTDDAVIWEEDGNTSMPTLRNLNVAMKRGIGQRQLISATRREQSQSSGGGGGGGGGSRSNSNWGGHRGIQVANMVQTDGDLVYMVYEAQVVVLRSDTASIVQRINTLLQTPFSNIAGLLLLDANLVVITQEYGANGDDSYRYVSFSPSSTTILVYERSHMTPVTRDNLQGRYIGAHAVGNSVYVSTSDQFPSIDELYSQLYFSPAYIQSLTNTTVNESSYRKTAQEQLELLVEPLALRFTQDLDCTGFLRLPFLNTTAAAIDAPSTMTWIGAFDMASPLFPKTVTSLLLPDSYLQVFQSEEMLILAYEETRCTDILSCAEPRSRLIALQLINGTVAFSSSGTVPGTVRSSSHLDHFKKGEKAFIRIATTTYGDIAGYDDDAWPTVGLLSILEVDGSNNMTLVGQLSGLGKSDDAMISVLFGRDRVLAVTCSEMESPNSTLYTIGTWDPYNPILIGNELELMGYHWHLVALEDDLILSVSAPHSDLPNEALVSEPFRLALSQTFNMSQTTRLIQQWDAVDSAAANASVHLNRTRSSSDVTGTVQVAHEIDENIASYQFDSDSNTLIIPVRTVVTTFVSCDPPYAGNVQTSVDEYGNSTCSIEQLTFDGFWLFKINATGGGILDHFVVDHGSPELQRTGCDLGAPTEYDAYSLVFNGDAMTLSRGIVQSYDLLTKEKTPNTPLILDPACEPLAEGEP